MGHGLLNHHPEMDEREFSEPKAHAQPCSRASLLRLTTARSSSSSADESKFRADPCSNMQQTRQRGAPTHPRMEVEPGKHSPLPPPLPLSRRPRIPITYSTTTVRCGSAHLQHWKWRERVGATPSFSDWPAKRGEGQDTNAALDTSCCVERLRWLHLCAVSCELQAAAGLTLHTKCSLQNLSSPPRRIRVPAYRPTSLTWVPKVPSVPTQSYLPHLRYLPTETERKKKLPRCTRPRNHVW